MSNFGVCVFVNFFGRLPFLIPPKKTPQKEPPLILDAHFRDNSSHDLIFCISLSFLANRLFCAKPANFECFKCAYYHHEPWFWRLRTGNIVYETNFWPIYRALLRLIDLQNNRVPVKIGRGLILGLKSKILGQKQKTQRLNWYELVWP